MTVTPIKHGSVHFKKCDLAKNRLLLGIDCGYSLTKVIFLHKDNTPLSLADDTDFATLTYAIFNNEDFAGAITFVRDQAYVPETTQNYVHVTGNINSTKKNIIEKSLGLKVEHVDKSLTTMAGYRIALEHIGLEAMIAAPVEVQGYGEIKSKFIDKFIDAMTSKFKKEGLEGSDGKPLIFPCLVNVINSASEFYYFDEEGKAEMVSYPTLGGLTFLGLAKCLLNTNMYDDVMALASTGNRGNVDTQVKDVMNDDPNSPYGTFPPDMPMFSFGKGMDLNKGLESYKREDLAMALVGFYTLCTIVHASSMCQLKKTPKLFLAGNIFRSNLFQQEITRSMMSFPFGLKLEILDSAYCGALGAMLCSNGDKEKYWK